MTYAKHVWQDGSRSHVVSWVRTHVGVKRVCSCPNCEINQEDTPSQAIRQHSQKGRDNDL